VAVRFKGKVLKKDVEFLPKKPSNAWRGQPESDAWLNFTKPKNLEVRIVL